MSLQKKKKKINFSFSNLMIKYNLIYHPYNLIDNLLYIIFKINYFNQVVMDGTIKKAYNSNNNVITKKETQILLDYFNEL